MSTVVDDGWLLKVTKTEEDEKSVERFRSTVLQVVKNNKTARS